jgi:NADH dehydrogenase [ubiquinone] 1 alpha subcomplex assembly factor 1
LFLRKKYLDQWKHYSHFLIKCRGDGRWYKLMLYSPTAVDVTWGDCHGYPLHTHGGPYWQYEKVPFSRFFHTIWGRVQDKQEAVRPSYVNSIGIVIMDRVDGEFQLEIDFIGVCNDTTHREKFAYEQYVTPVPFSESFT